MDWPEVKARIVGATYSELEPIPVPKVDLGTAAATQPSGPAATALKWEMLNPEGFERLLFNLLSVVPNFQNVQWLMRTNAPDRGRDISAERVIDDGCGGIRTERVILQAKHWRTKSVNAQACSESLAQVQLWQPPIVHSLIIASSGKFSADGVQWFENHNQKGQLPLIEAWPDSHLERLLAGHPSIVAAEGLR